ncbi:MAG: methyltransferase domain-containing protein [Deltaproteobacteria bacterium]|nr:methyltransferase domain-containing protein [Deltaproteobacteria bacterium]
MNHALISSSSSAREVQVAPEHYDFETYDDLERWNSYWYQIRSAIRLKPETVLEIGSGSGVFRSYLRNAGIDVKSADIDDSRKPDIVCDVCDLDGTLPEGMKFDVVAAFQVLEHLPFPMFEKCLDGIARRASPYALISLPVHGIQLRLSFGLGDLHLGFGWKMRKPWKFRPNKEHHWELGWGYSVGRITRIMSSRFDVLDRFYVKENPYHYLWVLRSKVA